MSSLGQAKLARAIEYILAHKEESKEEQAIGARVSSGTIAAARAKLIREGTLAPTRNKKPAVVAPPTAVHEAPPDPLAPKKTQAMLDHEAMVALAAMVDELSGLDDEEVFKRIQRQCLLFTFDGRLSADTRMSASQMWAKLRDRSKEKDLGPGVPLTFEDAVGRLSELMIACGPEITLAAVNVSFTVQETPDGKVEQDDPPHSPPEAPSTT